MGNEKEFEIEYKIDYRDVKYPRLEFKTGNLLLVMPQGCKNNAELIEKYKNWIFKRSTQILSASKSNKLLNQKRSEEELKGIVHKFAKEFCKELNVNINNIYFKQMNSKWASCSTQKSLTINTLLKYLPDKLITYVIFHEIAHIQEKKHNESFWKIINSHFPDYTSKEKELFEYWFAIHDKIER